MKGKRFTENQIIRILLRTGSTVSDGCARSTGQHRRRKPVRIIVVQYAGIPIPWDQQTKPLIRPNQH